MKAQGHEASETSAYGASHLCTHYPQGSGSGGHLDWAAGSGPSPRGNLMGRSRTTRPEHLAGKRIWLLQSPRGQKALRLASLPQPPALSLLEGPAFLSLPYHSVLTNLCISFSLLVIISVCEWPCCFFSILDTLLLLSLMWLIFFFLLLTLLPSLSLFLVQSASCSMLWLGVNFSFHPLCLFLMGKPTVTPTWEPLWLLSQA